MTRDLTNMTCLTEDGRVAGVVADASPAGAGVSGFGAASNLQLKAKFDLIEKMMGLAPDKQDVALKIDTHDEDDMRDVEKRECPTFSFYGAKLAPSEVVLLYGDKFAPPGGPARFRQEKLLRTNYSLSSAELSRAVWMAALLSLHATGQLKIEINSKSSPLAREEKALYVSALGGPCRWPVGSLERKICQMLRQGRWEPHKLVYRLVEQEGWRARYNTLRLVKEGLLERGLLTVKESRRLGIFGFRHYKLARRTLMMVPEHGLEHLLGLLKATEPAKLALLRELRDQTERGLAKARYIMAKRIANDVADLGHGISGFFH